MICNKSLNTQVTEIPSAIQNTPLECQSSKWQDCKNTQLINGYSFSTLKSKKMASSINSQEGGKSVNKCPKSVLSRMAFRGTARIQAFHQHSAHREPLSN